MSRALFAIKLVATWIYFNKPFIKLNHLILSSPDRDSMDKIATEFLLLHVTLIFNNCSNNIFMLHKLHQIMFKSFKSTSIKISLHMLTNTALHVIT